MSVIDVWFSCGAASAVAAKLTLEKYGDDTVRVLNNPIIEEDADNRRFLCDVQEWLGVEVISVTNPDYPLCSVEDVWARRKFMAGRAGAPCTGALKKRARQLWEREHPSDWTVLGFTVEEKPRHDRFVLTERPNVLPVLIDAGLTKQDCYAYLHNAGIPIPRMYLLGYPNANCVGCVKATSPTYWNHVRRQHPDVFESRAIQSRGLGARLVRVAGTRVFLDELSPHAKGHPLKGLDFECGLFCEETA